MSLARESLLALLVRESFLALLQAGIPSREAVRTMKRALIIVDHGSTRPAANRMLDDLAALLRERTTDLVYPAHMDLAEPTIAQAFETAVAAGADFIFVFPYFLSPGRHSREDIPQLCVQAAARHPNVTWHCSGPIGLDPLMADLILHRAQLCQTHNFKCEHCPSVGFCTRESD
jgi:sirohydrochlorin ferrochelatase